MSVPLPAQVNELIISAFKHLQLTPPEEIELDTQPQQGELSTNVAMKTFKNVSDNRFPNPRALAQAVVDQISTLLVKTPNPTIARAELAGPGFINFYLSEHFLQSEIGRFSDEQGQIVPNLGKGKIAVVEYSSPNIAKPFTIGHLRSTIIGHSVAQLLEAVGYEVKRDNHLGDWGTQFGKQIYAIKTWGNEEEIEHSERPVKKLVELYVKFHEAAEKDPALDDEARAWFKKLEDGDAEARRLWQKCIEWSLKEFKLVYSELGVVFTENGGTGYGESFFEHKMQPVIEELEEKGLLKEGESGAKLVFYPPDQFSPLMIIKKDGATLYATRDLATDKFRLEKYGPEVLVINEVGGEQATYFQQLYKLEEMLGWYQPGQRVHVKHGFYRFKDKKMSTRKGNVIWLEEVLEEAKNRALELAKTKEPALAAKVGIGALKWNDLKRSSQIDVVFDWDEILNMKGNSGPYLQYSYVRAHSILEKAKTQKKRSIAKPFDTSLYSMNQSEATVAKHLIRFPLVVELAATEYAPHHLATYLYELAQAFNVFYTETSVLGEDVTSEAQTFRLSLTQAVARVLQIGLNLLGIETVEKM
jgi:arginyl-tRNA synthetase